MKNKKKRKVTSTKSSPLPTTIASLPDDVVEDILLRLPSFAAICRAVFAYKHWILVASSTTFLRRLRDFHDYPLLLGHFVSPDDRHGSTPTHFQPARLRSPESDGVLAAMVRRGDFFLTRIQARGSGRHVLEDCSDGLLLFSDTGTLTLRIFDPMTHRVSSVPQLPRRGGGVQDHRGRTLCLLPNGDDPNAFRVMSLQHRYGKKLARLEVYNSCTRAWGFFPEARRAKIPARRHIAHIYSATMHAGNRIFWKYNTADSLLLLDTETMTFSDVHLPPGVTRQSAYAVGETEDGTCCLVHVFQEGARWYSRRMQVWRFRVGDNHEGNGAPMWELERQVPLILHSQSACFSVDQVRAIVRGIVLLCFSSPTPNQHHIAFRLKNLKVEADFKCHGLARPFGIE